MDKVKFHFDPRCPWCYQTSRWIRRLEELGEVEADWGIFSLEVVNLEAGKDPRQIDAVFGTGCGPQSSSGITSVPRRLGRSMQRSASESGRRCLQRRTSS